MRFSSDKDELLYHFEILERSCYVLGFLAQKGDFERNHDLKDHDSFFVMELAVKFIDPFIAKKLDPKMNALWKICTNYIDHISDFEDQKIEGNFESLCVGITLVYLSIKDGEIVKSELKERVEIVLGERKSWGSYSPLDCIEMVIRNLQISTA